MSSSTSNLHNAFDEQPDEIFGVTFAYLDFKDIISFRMSSKGYYSGLRNTYTEEHRTTIDLNWMKIFECGGVDYIKRIFVQDNKIAPSKKLYTIACNQIYERHTKDIPEDRKSTRLNSVTSRSRMPSSA